MQKESKIRKFLIGFAVLIFLSVITGNIGFLLISIICTGGISMVVYYPLSYLIGSLVEKFLIRKNDPFTEDMDNSKKEVVLSNKQKALIDYIRKSKLVGNSDNKIFEILIANGWEEKDVREAYGLMARI